MSFEELFQPPVISSLITTLVTAFFAVNTFFFRWLMSSFSKLRDLIEEQEKEMRDWLNEHEDRDQLRHEENLHRFEKIAVALARMGSTNGTRDFKPKWQENLS
jgi:hypothetical protein